MDRMKQTEETKGQRLTQNIEEEMEEERGEKKVEKWSEVNWTELK